MKCNYPKIFKRALAFLVSSLLVTHYSANVPAAQAATSKAPVELTSLETPYTQTFRNPNGTIHSKVYFAPVNYRDQNGNFKHINTNLIKNPSGGFEVNKDRFTSKLAAQGNSSKLESITYKGKQVSFSLAPSSITKQLGSKFLQQPKTTSGTPSKNQITYSDVFKNVDLKEQITSLGVKETIVLKKYLPGIRSLAFVLNAPGLTHKIDKNGNVDFEDSKGNVLFYIPHGVMQDSNVDPHSGIAPSSSGVTYSFKTIHHKTLFIVTMAQNWLSDASRVYPVYVDPTFDVTIQSQISDAFTSSAYPTTNYSNSSLYDSSLDEYNVRVGDYDSSTGDNRAFFKLPSSSLLPLWGLTVQSASFHAYDVWSYYSSTAENTWLWANTSSNWSPSTITWDTMPSHASSPVSSVSTHRGEWAVFNITSLAQNWSNQVAGSSYTYSPQEGFFLSEDGNGTAYWHRFTAMENTIDMPYISIAYDAPTAPYGALYTHSDDASGFANLWWNPVQGAADYKVYIWNGHSYQAFDAGDNTHWTSKGRGIWPTSSEIAAGNYLLHTDGKGTELEKDPAPVYQNAYAANGGTNDSSDHKYQFCIAAVGSDGKTISGLSSAFEPTMQNYIQDEGSAPTMVPLMAGSANGATGNFVKSATDLQTSGYGPQVDIQRTYNQNLANQSGPFGKGWTFGYQTHIILENNIVHLISSDGSGSLYWPNPDGTYAPPPGQSTWRLTKNSSGGFDLTLPDYTVEHFTQVGTTSTYRLSSIEDKNHKTLTLSYNSSNQLSSLKDASGRTTTLAYNTDGTIHTITDSNNQTWTYGYDANEDLISVNDPLGKVEKYSYDRKTLLTSPDVLSNGDFETDTSAATMLNDNLTNSSGWTTEAGSFSFGSNGATSTTSVSVLQATTNSWSPQVGSGGQNIPLSEQATFTTPSSVPQRMEVDLYQDSENFYDAVWQGDNNFVIYKIVKGTWTAIAASGAISQSANTTYTIKLQLDGSGHLTATILNTSNSSIATISATATDLSGPYKAQIKANTGVLVSNVQVSSGWPDNWASWNSSSSIVHSESLVSTPVYSGGKALQLSVSNLPSSGEQVFSEGVGVQPNMPYVFNGMVYIKSLTNAAVGLKVDYYDANGTYITSDVMQNMTSTTSGYVPLQLSGIAPSNAASAHVYFLIENSGPSGGGGTIFLDDASFQYGMAVELTGITDPNGNTATISYAPSDRVTRETNAAGKSESVTYGKGNVTYTDPTGVQTIWSYDSDHLTTQKVLDPSTLNQVWKYQYNEEGEVTQTTDPLGNIMTNTYNGAWQLVSTTDPNGHTTTMTYNNSSYQNINHDVTSVTTPVKDTYRFKYDDNHDQAVNQQPQEEKVDTSYNSQGTVASEVTIPPDNGLSNNSFESWSSSMPTGWSVWYSSGSTYTSMKSSNRVFGGASWGIKDATGTVAMYPSSGLVPLQKNGASFEVMAYATTTAAAESTFAKIDFMDSSGHQITEVTSPVLGVAGKWKKLSVSIDPSEYPSNATQCRVGIRSIPGSAEVDVDAADFNPTSELVPNYNAFINGSFNQQLTGWQGIGSGTVTAATDQSLQGDTYSAKMTASSSGATGIIPNDSNEYIPYVPGQTYYFGGFMKGNNVGNTYFELNFRDSNKATLGHEFGVISSGTFDWKSADVVLNSNTSVPSGTAYIEPEVFTSSGSGGTVWMDDLYLTFIPEKSSFAYDSTGDLTSVTDPLGNITKMTYNAEGDPLTVTDPSGNQASMTYDADHEMLTQTLPGGIAKGEYTYDANGNVTQEKVTSGSGSTTYETLTNQYNNLNQVTASTDALNRVTKYAYNADGRLTTVTLPDGHQVTVGYDSVGNPTSVSVDGSTVSTATYDEDNNVSSIKSGNISTSLTRDKDGNITKQTDSVGSQTFGYNADNALTSRAFTVGSTTFTNTYILNNQDQVVAMKNGSTTLGSFGYNQANQIDSVSLGNGLKAMYRYDADHRIQTVIILDKSGGVYAALGYQYDKNGNITNIIDLQTNKIVASYQYDRLNQITKETQANGTVVNYTYDALGNITKRAVTPSGGTTTTTNYTYDSGNELTAVNGQAYTYNSNGELTSDGKYTYKWNELGELTEVDNTNTGTVVASYTYDALGRRVSETTGGNTTKFYYIGGSNLVSYETDGSGNLKKSYTYGPTGEPLTLTTWTNGTGITYYYHENSHGDVVALTDSSGNTVAQYTYDAWGNTLSSSGTVASTNRLRYAGYRWDSVVGMYYLNARYYNPETMRFISEDPLNEINAYAYAGDNPARYADPTGLLEEEELQHAGGGGSFDPELDLNVREELPSVPDEFQIMEEDTETALRNSKRLYQPTERSVASSEVSHSTDNITSEGTGEETGQTLYHYTNEKGMNGITSSNSLNSSLKAINPKDARYGNGQYLSNIKPGTKTTAELSKAFINNPFQGARFTHYVEINVKGLNVVERRPGVFVIPNEGPLNLTGRIVSFGQVP